MKIQLNLLIYLLLLCSICSFAQDRLIIHLQDETNKPIPFYTVENVKYSDIKYVADSSGKASIPKIIGMAYKIHALGYADTLITIHDNNDIHLTLKANNTLNEVTVKSPIIYSKAETFKSSRTNEFNYYGQGNTDFNSEMGRIISIDKNIWLQQVSFKVKSKYIMDFKKFVFVNIYKVNEKLEKELEALKTKKIGPHQFSFPDLIFSSHLNDNYTVSLNNKLLTFDLSKQSIYLEPGKYIVVMELMAKTTIGIMPYYSRQKECLGLCSNNNAKIVAWFTDFWFGKYINIIADINYLAEK